MKKKQMHLDKEDKTSEDVEGCTCSSCLRIRKYERPRFDDLKQFDDLDIFKKDTILFKK